MLYKYLCLYNNNTAMRQLDSGVIDFYSNYRSMTYNMSAMFDIVKLQVDFKFVIDSRTIKC